MSKCPIPPRASHRQTKLNVIDSDRPRLSALAAQKKRKETGDDRYYAPIERKNIPFSQRLRDIIEKPFKILFSEPMLIAITIYQSVSLATTCGLCDVLTEPRLVHFWVRLRFRPYLATLC